MTARRTTTALIQSALEAWIAAGLPVGAVEVSKGGVVRVLAPEAVSAQPSAQEGNTCDSLFGGASD